MNETRELWVSDEERDAILKTRKTLERLGKLTNVTPGVALEGIVSFGLQSATVKITWRAESEKLGNDKREMGGGTASALTGPVSGTILTIEAQSTESPQAARSAVERFEEAYRHYGDPGYKPDRLGVMPITIIGIVLVLFLLGFILWRIPTFRKNLPNMPGPRSVQGSPSPLPSPN